MFVNLGQNANLKNIGEFEKCSWMWKKIAIRNKNLKNVSRFVIKILFDFFCEFINIHEFFQKKFPNSKNF